MEPYDYIIVGGGTAGCILANRLTASGQHRVLMLEAGGEPASMWINIPAGFSKLLTNTQYNWRFQTEAEENTNQRVIAVPRGKGLGGSTLINGMVYVRGQSGDYDAWRDAGACGWAWKDVEPYFRKLENYDKGGPTRGHEGPMKLAQVRERFPISDAFIRAAREDGLSFNEDYNAGRQEGVGYYQVTQSGGRRWSVYDGYLRPALRRKNLAIVTHAHVVRLEISGQRCTGVTYRRNGVESTVNALAEVVLAAGAIQSPQLLELSGVGRAELLQSHGIAVRHDLRGVGENYIDHFCTRMNWRVKDAVTLNEMSRNWRLGLAVSEYYARRTGILTLGTGLVNAFVKTKPEMPTADAQYFFMHASYANAAERVLDKLPGMTIGVTQLRPESVGTIHIKSPDPSAGPSIRPNFLSSPVDRECMVRSMQIARRIVERPALQRHVVEEMSPGIEVRSDADWLAFARQNGQTIYHPIGTCRMGEDDAAVVDLRLRVRGMSGLRIVDASVMPRMVSGNIQAAVMMVAEKAADLILEDASRR
ncbi:GMC family oxidoreductase N-terminal domain-containing protein [Variovorax sp. J31P207]|uniref:GMC family oxidoreductase n=1 Tax=Variovorax sp. J31P207 TaxID=3053510 RepID=UPI0025755D0F|nr:GMC family oxidoreductase N-terminal domain-containing protein [Variovorax sp. J31P207]MDM0071666.1 GMC family oxidoreductase N-terminal domain-containing protein [Variovorax sp. J31P207]